MAKKRDRGKRRSSAANTTSPASPSDDSRAIDVSQSTATDPATEPARKQQRTERVRDRRTRRKASRSVADHNQGVRPWIMPGLAGIAVIAIVLVGVLTVSNDQDNITAAADVPSPAIGEATAEVVIHEYGDYQCAFCGVFARTIKPQLQERFIETGIARLVWHDFAWYGDESDLAANAARCAGDQGQFWDYHDLLFDRQSGTNNGTFSRDNLVRLGSILGLEARPFESCVDGNTYRAAIAADMNRVRQLGLNGTPSFTIGDQRIVGA